MGKPPVLGELSSQLHPRGRPSDTSSRLYTAAGGLTCAVLAVRPWQQSHSCSGLGVLTRKMGCAGGGRRHRRCWGGGGRSPRTCSPWTVVSHMWISSSVYVATQRGPTERRGRVLVNTWKGKPGSAPAHCQHSRAFLLAGFLQARGWALASGDKCTPPHPVSFPEPLPA